MDSGSELSKPCCLIRISEMRDKIEYSNYLMILYGYYEHLNCCKPLCTKGQIIVTMA